MTSRKVYRVNSGALLDVGPLGPLYRFTHKDFDNRDEAVGHYENLVSRKSPEFRISLVEIQNPDTSTTSIRELEVCRSEQPEEHKPAGPNDKRYMKPLKDKIPRCPMCGEEMEYSYELFIYGPWIEIMGCCPSMDCDFMCLMTINTDEIND